MLWQSADINEQQQLGGPDVQSFQGAHIAAYGDLSQQMCEQSWQHQQQAWQQPFGQHQHYQQQHDRPQIYHSSVGTQQSQLHSQTQDEFYAGASLQPQMHSGFDAGTTPQSQMHCCGSETAQHFQEGLSDGATDEYQTHRNIRHPSDPLSLVQRLGADTMQQMQTGWVGVAQQPQMQGFDASLLQQQQQHQHHQQRRPETHTFAVEQVPRSQEHPGLLQTPAQKMQQEVLPLGKKQLRRQQEWKSKQASRAASHSVHEHELCAGLVLALDRQDVRDCEPSQPSLLVEGAGADGRKVKLVPFDGPNFCKLLVPNHIAGALIGKEGTMAGEIELLSKCKMQISGPKAFFPGTHDRVCIIGGPTTDGLTLAVSRIVELLQEISHNPHKNMVVKIVVPMSAASTIIGRKGEIIQRMIVETGCRINMSPRVEGFQERLVIVSGETDALNQAVCRIVNLVQADPHLQEHMYSTYTQDLPLGSWTGESMEPADRKVKLIHPDRAKDYKKRDIIEYISKAAPREMVVRLGLMGSMKNAVKSKGVGELHEAVAEVWHLRGGALLEAHEVDGPIQNLKGSEEHHEDTGPAMPRPVGQQGPVKVGLLPPSQPAASASSSKLVAPVPVAEASIPVAPTSKAVTPAAASMATPKAVAPAAAAIVASKAATPAGATSVASNDVAPAAATGSVASKAVAPVPVVSATIKAVAPVAVASVASLAAAAVLAAAAASVASNAMAPAAAASVATKVEAPAAAASVTSNAVAPAAAVNDASKAVAPAVNASEAAVPAAAASVASEAAAPAAASSTVASRDVAPAAAASVASNAVAPAAAASVTSKAAAPVAAATIASKPVVPVAAGNVASKAVAPVAAASAASKAVAPGAAASVAPKDAASKAAGPAAAASVASKAVAPAAGAAAGAAAAAAAAAAGGGGGGAAAASAACSQKARQSDMSGSTFFLQVPIGSRQEEVGDDTSENSHFSL
eukprot:TRINITY_DN16817_c0_g3_i2.p1 TRINITY_DN16817_c0_g3~~TRINITY_DN16817_c0_g3_i2.p1  ORF type:complete len:969 (+),score=241.26 TRINITY_DN16817_c0_g3_i2:83-2989(+)